MNDKDLAKYWKNQYDQIQKERYEFRMLRDHDQPILIQALRYEVNKLNKAVQKKNVRIKKLCKSLYEVRQYITIGNFDPQDFNSLKQIDDIEKTGGPK
jgi:hypothetical protein